MFLIFHLVKSLAHFIYNIFIFSCGSDILTTSLSLSDPSESLHASQKMIEQGIRLPNINVLNKLGHTLL